MFQLVAHWINGNNSIDIFQKYFTDPKYKKMQISVPSSTTIEVLDDPCTPTRPVQHISWSAQHGNLIAVSYADLRFQMADPNCSSDSFVFDLGNTIISIIHNRRIKKKTTAFWGRVHSSIYKFVRLKRVFNALETNSFAFTCSSSGRLSGFTVKTVNIIVVGKSIKIHFKLY